MDTTGIDHREEGDLEREIAARYPTPPEETRDERKARLHRRRQFVYQRRRRTATVSISVQQSSAEQPSTSSVTVNRNPLREDVLERDIAARYPEPPVETQAARNARLSRKRQFELRCRRRIGTVSISETIAPSLQNPSASLPNISSAVFPANVLPRQNRREYQAQQRKRLIRRYGQRTLRTGLGYHNNYNRPERHLLGPRQPCLYCAAQKWPGETPSMCCNSGQIVIPPFDEPPAALRELFANRQFLQRIRCYNNAFAFTSMGASVRTADPVRQDQSVAARGSVYNYRIQGALCHRIGGLASLPGRDPIFAQLYFYDSTSEQQRTAIIDARTEQSGGLSRQIIQTLQTMFEEINPLAKIFRHAYERMASDNNLQLHIHARLPGVDRRRYNRPTADEIGGILVSTDHSEPRDIVLENRATGALRKVFDHNQLYDALQYPLLHPFGEVGWTFGMPKAPRQNNASSVRGLENANSGDDDPQERTSSRQISPREYAAYRLCWREGDHSLIHYAGRLMQQYCVDQYCKMEAQRLKYQREHQANLRADVYAGVMDLAGVDHVANDLQKQNQQQQSTAAATRQPNATGTLGRSGTRIILAPSFVGSDRYMRAQYQDAMAMVRAMGKPDLFITVTCNPLWTEITEALLPRQQAADRPDLTARVFRLKLKAILEDLSAGVLGLQVARIHVIEFQKRGLPHAHCLVILADDDKPRTPEDYDRLVSAELPDPENVQLYETIRKCMIHGPCGRSYPHAPCMKDGACSKHYPKAFCEQTRQAENGYPLYRRCNNGRTVNVKGNVELDNRYVVPYNPWLCHKYNAHINVEVCTTITSVKYLYKYVYKGHDRLAVSSNETVDEIQQYLDARYISASESCWRIMRFELQAKSHTIIQLPIHLKNAQSVTFRENDTIESVLNRGHDTMLTRFFELAANDAFAATLTYQDVPMYYRFVIPTARQKLSWHGSGKHWIRRSRNDGTVIGRMVSCSMTLMERYCMRLLLCYRKGPTSFEDLCTVEGTLFATYHQAATVRGLLHDDSEWERTLREAVTFQMPAQLRHLFALILSEGVPQNPRRLWDAFVDHLCEDFRHNHRARYTAEDSDENRILRDIEQLRTLQAIEDFLRGTTPPKHLSSFKDLPQLADFAHVREHLMAEVNVNVLLNAERSYSISALDETLLTVGLLNSEQRAVYEIITAAVDRAPTNVSTCRFFFLDGPGGTGKSFLLEKVLAYTRRQSKIALAAASSGIAALLLSGGKTAHSTFKLPLVLDENSQCAIPGQSHLADLIRQASLIVWDEASMSSRYALEAVDRALQDIVGISQPFGGKVMLLCGDFRQILPIVPKGTDAQIINQCLKQSPLWQHCRVLRLRTNMRVQTAPDAHHATELRDFSEFLLSIGEGRHPTFPELGTGFAKIPRDMVLPRSTNPDTDVLALIGRIYPNIERYYKDPAFFTNRAILSPMNVDVTSINNGILERVPETEEEYLSVDTLVNPEEHEHLQLPAEFLNSLNMSGVPLHRLRLKRYVPVLLLRNLNTERGLCNGTRLQVVNLKRNCIHARILTGKRRGDDVLLPRIFCDSNDAGLPFQIRRKQFPVQVCFAMTINKSQGQSLHHLGLYLPSNVFAHGQLYVALSRVTSRQNVAILVQQPEKEDEEGVATKNIVYKEIVGSETSICNFR